MGAHGRRASGCCAPARSQVQVPGDTPDQGADRGLADAATTQGLLTRLASEDLRQALNWKGPKRVGKVEPMARVLWSHRIDDVPGFRETLRDPVRRAAVRSDLDGVWGVGRKTLNYLNILVGDSDAVAIDARITSVARAAGITRLTPAYLEDVITEAADRGGWRPGVLDAAMWKHTQD